MHLGKLGRILSAAALLIFGTLLLVGCGGSGSNKFINIATGGTAGTYYPIGGAMAEILNKAIPGMNASAQSTGATVENLRGIAALYPETCQIVTLESTGIKSIADLKGKRVAVGAAGSGAEANARQILEAYGITYDDIDEQFLSFGEAASALKDGNVDAAFVTAGFPTAAVQDITSQNKVRLLPIEADKADALIAKYPFYTKTKIPAGTYAGFDEDVPGISVMAMLVATDKVDEKLGYDITKALFDNIEKLQAAHSAAKQITKESAKDGMSIELNAGAERYYKE